MKNPKKAKPESELKENLFKNPRRIKLKSYEDMRLVSIGVNNISIYVPKKAGKREVLRRIEEARGRYA